MARSSSDQDDDRILLDAGVLIAALVKGDARHAEARLLVLQARYGEMSTCTTASILSELYAALTWEQTDPRRSPREAAQAVLSLIEGSSAITVLNEDSDVALRTMGLAAEYGLTARRIHDARHASAALVAGIRSVYTYDVRDWKVFESQGLRIVGPPSVLARLGRESVNGR